MHIIRIVNFQWNPAKERINRRKHGIAFADAISVLEDDRAITIDDENIDEDRYITIGMNAMGQILVVIYTWRGESIRIISARNATSAERKEYEKWR